MAQDHPEHLDQVYRSSFPSTQVLVDGSYKYFKKIAIALSLAYSRNMDLINIEEWAASCLDNRSTDACC